MGAVVSDQVLTRSGANSPDVTAEQPGAATTAPGAVMSEAAQGLRPHSKKDAEARIRQLLAQRKAAQRQTETALIAAAQHYQLPADEVLKFYRQNIERAHYFTAEGCAVLYRARQKRRESQ